LEPQRVLLVEVLGLQKVFLVEVLGLLRVLQV